MTYEGVKLMIELEQLGIRPDHESLVLTDAQGERTRSYPTSSAARSADRPAWISRLKCLTLPPQRLQAFAAQVRP